MSQVSINHENLAALNLDKLIVDSFLSDKRRECLLTRQCAGGCVVTLRTSDISYKLVVRYGMTGKLLT